MPFALSFYPSESFELYNLLSDALEKFNINSDILTNKIVLSDLGGAIKKFCKLHSIKQYFCHRHLIEIFGAHCAFGIWAARLLRCKTYLEYLKERIFIKQELYEYIEEKNNSPLNDQDDIEKSKNSPLNDQDVTEESKNSPLNDQDINEESNNSPQNDQDIAEESKNSPLNDQDETEESNNSPQNDQDETEESNNSPQNDQDDNIKIKNLEIMLLNIDEVENLPNKEEIKNSFYYLPNWAIWIRRQDKVGTFSNHSEGFYGIIDEKISKSGKHSIKTSISVISNYLLNYINRRQEIYGDSFQKKHTKLINKIIEIVEQEPNSYLRCSQQNCECEEQIFNQLIYGVHFNCIHQVLKSYINSRIFQIIKDDLNLNIQSFFLICLKTFPKNSHESKSFIRVIDLKQKEIIAKYEKDNSIQFDKTSKAYVLRAIYFFLNSFRYDLPQIFQVDLNDPKWNFNQLKDEAVECTFEFDDRKSNDTLRKLKLKNINDNLTLIDQLSERKYLIKKNISKPNMKLYQSIQSSPIMMIY